MAEDYRQKYIVEVEIQKDKAQKSLEEIERKANSTGESIDKALNGGSGNADAAVGSFDETIRKFEELRGNLEGMAEGNANTIDSYIREIESLGSTNTEATEEIINALKTLDDLNSGVAQEAMSTLDQFEELNNRIVAVKQQMDTLAKSGQTDTSEYKALSDELENLQSMSEETATDIEGMINTFDSLSTALSGGNDELSDLNPILEKLNEITQSEGADLSAAKDELLSYISGIGVKTAAEKGSTAATIGLDVAMKALNRTLKANLITAIMSLLVGLVNLLKSGLSELWKYVSGEKALNDVAGKYSRTLDDVNRKYERQEKLLRATGAAEALILQNRINKQKESIEQFKAEERELVKNRTLWQRIFGISGKTIDRIGELRKKQKEANEEIDDLNFDKVVDNTAQQTAYDRDAKARKAAAKEENERLMEETMGEIARLQARHRFTLQKIEDERNDYIEEAKKNWNYDADGKGPQLDLSGFDMQKANATKKYQNAMAELTRKYNEELKNSKRLTDEINTANERSKRMNMASVIADQVTQMRLLKEEREAQLESLKKEKQTKLDAVQQRGDLTDAQKKDLSDQIEQQYAAQGVAITQDAETERVKIITDATEQILEIYERSASDRNKILSEGLDEEAKKEYDAELERIQKSVANEEERYRKIKDLQDKYSGQLTGISAENYDQVDKNQTFDLNEIKDILDEESVEIFNEMNEYVNTLLNESLTMLQETVIPELEAELRRITKEGGDVSKTSARLSTARKRANQLKDAMGGVTTETTKSGKATLDAADKWLIAAKVMKETSSIVNDLTNEFGDYISESTKETLTFVSSSLNAMGDIVDGVGKAMQTASSTASESMKAMESASVILAIISAAIQLAMAIAKMIKFYSADAKLQREIEALENKLDKLRSKQKLFQLSMDAKHGLEYWRDMYRFAKSYDENIANLQKQISDEEERLALARSQKKKEQIEKELLAKKEQLAEEIAAQRDAFKTLYDEVLQTDLKSFSDTLANDVFSSFDEGCRDMSQVWKGTIESMLDAALKAQFSRILEDKLSDLFDKMEHYSTDGILTEDELDRIMQEADRLSNIINTEAQAFQKIRESLGLTNQQDVEGSKGAFQTMSQDTAEELNGRFTALQMSGAAIAEGIDNIRLDFAGMRSATNAVNDNVEFILGVQQMQLNELQEINANTANLVQMRNSLQRIERVLA